MFPDSAVGWYVEYYYPGYRDDETERFRTVFFVDSEGSVVDYEDLTIHGNDEDWDRWREISESDLDFLGGFDVDLSQG